MPLELTLMSCWVISTNCSTSSHAVMSTGVESCQHPHKGRVFTYSPTDRMLCTSVVRRTCRSAAEARRVQAEIASPLRFLSYLLAFERPKPTTTYPMHGTSLELITVSCRSSSKRRPKSARWTFDVWSSRTTPGKRFLRYSPALRCTRPTTFGRRTNDFAGRPSGPVFPRLPRCPVCRASGRIVLYWPTSLGAHALG
jgi:hypothetical protein